MGVAVTIEGKDINKGCVVIDILSGLVQYKNSLNGEVLRTFNMNKDVNVYCDIADIKSNGVYKDLHDIAVLALNARVYTNKEVNETKKDLAEQRILYDILKMEYEELKIKYERLQQYTVEAGKDIAYKEEYKWWEQFT